MQRSPATDDARKRLLGQVVAHLCEGLVEREAQARCLVLAALCGEHLLFLGPPGTAKSELSRRLHHVVGGRYFERLLTRFSVPEELFGPLSLAALDEGRYERDIEGYLPTASIAFLDEIFKANSAILNALLTLLHEREFDQGARRIPTPLITVVGASNEVPDEEALKAFFDRFLFRCPVAPVSESGFERLLALDEQPPAQSPRLSPEELHSAAQEASGVVLDATIRSMLIALREFAAEHRITVSDRRWVRIVRALKIAAATNGRGEVGLDDLCLLPFLVGESAEQASLLEQWVAERFGAAGPVDSDRLARVIQAFDKQLELEGAAAELAFDDSGKLALVQRVGGAQTQTMSDAAPRMSAFSRRKRFSATHIGARIAQIDAVLAEIDAFERDALRHLDEWRARLAGNLWVAPVFAQRLIGVLALNHRQVAVQRGALARVREAFAGLPIAEVDDGVAPEPIGEDA